MTAPVRTEHDTGGRRQNNARHARMVGQGLGDHAQGQSQGDGHARIIESGCNHMDCRVQGSFPEGRTISFNVLSRAQRSLRDAHSV